MIQLFDYIETGRENMKVLQDSSVSIVTSYRLDGWGFIPSRDKRFFSFPVSKLTLGPTQPPIQ
jgi:hypothetical protein